MGINAEMSVYFKRLVGRKYLAAHKKSLNMESNDTNKFEKYQKLKSEMELLKKRLSEIENEILQMIQNEPDIILAYPELQIVKEKFEISQERKGLDSMRMKYESDKLNRTE